MNVLQLRLEFTSPAAGDLVDSRKPGEVVRRYSYRRTGEGAGIEQQSYS
jgi:hypothetical protein